MKKKITTLLLVSDDNTSTRSYTIETKHILRLKKYLIGVTSVFLIFIVLTICLIAWLKISSNEKLALVQKIKTMENDVKLVDSLQIKLKINNIENRMTDINKYLKERGVAKEESGIGGGNDENKNTDLTIYDFYESHTNDIFVNICNIPLGYPIYGEVKSDYGYRANPFSGRSSEFHKGMDFKANIGDTVRCTADGIVESADWDNGYGKCVTIKHSYGFECKYGHLSQFNVVQGQEVKAGDVIGFVGSTGRSTGPHLHYEIRRYGTDINPHNYLTLN